MQKVFIGIVVSLFWGASVGAETVQVPWQDFKKLFAESIERDVMKTMPQQAEKEGAHVIETVACRIEIGQKQAQCVMLVQGRHLSGSLVPIPLLPTGTIVRSVQGVSNGSVVITKPGALAFLPTESGAFQCSLSFFLPSTEDDRSHRVTLSLPRGIKVGYSLVLDKELRLVTAPGIQDDNGTYHCGASNELIIRFKPMQALRTTTVIDVELFSRVKLAGTRLIVTTAFQADPGSTTSFLLRLPPEAVYLESTIKNSWITKQEDNAFSMRLPRTGRTAFTLSYALPAKKKSFVLSLPTVKDNTGREGAFVIDDAEDAQISWPTTDVLTQLPVSRLSAPLQALLPDRRYCHALPASAALPLNIRYFKSLPTPPLVLNNMQFFCSFEENGGVLSVLRMQIPAQSMPRLKLGCIEGAKIWSLTVNGVKQKVYTDDDNKWIIPLQQHSASQVELALLTKTKKLSLQGRLEALIPETGIPVRTLQVGIALPDRVDLISLEGAVNSDETCPGDAPREFVGNPYYFSRAFYKGTSMKLAIFYKEPTS
jgi:hypothetical protein